MDLRFGFHATKKRSLWELALSGIFRGVLRDFITAHAQKHHYYYFRFEIGPQIRIHLVEKHYTRDWAFKRILRALFGLLRDFITAHVQKHH